MREKKIFENSLHRIMLAKKQNKKALANQCKCFFSSGRGSRSLDLRIMKDADRYFVIFYHF